MTEQTFWTALSGMLPVIPTPFYQGRLDCDSLVRLFDYIFPALDGYPAGATRDHGFIVISRGGRTPYSNGWDGSK